MTENLIMKRCGQFRDSLIEAVREHQWIEELIKEERKKAKIDESDFVDEMDEARFIIHHLKLQMLRAAKLGKSVANMAMPPNASVVTILISWARIHEIRTECCGDQINFCWD